MWGKEGTACLQGALLSWREWKDVCGAESSHTCQFQPVCSFSLTSVGFPVDLTVTVTGRVGLGISIQLRCCHLSISGLALVSGRVSELRALQYSPGGTWALC